MYSGFPTSVHKMMMPWSSSGRLLSPLYTNIAAACSRAHAGGSNPSRFHTLVLPWWTLMCAWKNNSCGQACTPRADRPSTRRETLLLPNSLTKPQEQHVEPSRREGASEGLSPPLLVDVLHLSSLVFPQKCGRLATESADEWQQLTSSIKGEQPSHIALRDA